MTTKFKIDRVALAEIQKCKVQDSRRRGLPQPSADEMQERFLCYLLQSAVHDALESLTDENRELIQSVFLDRKKTVVEIAKSRDVARSTVHRQMTRSFEKLHEFLKYLPIVQAILVGTRKR